MKEEHPLIYLKIEKEHLLLEKRSSLLKSSTKWQLIMVSGLHKIVQK